MARKKKKIKEITEPTPVIYKVVSKKKRNDLNCLACVGEGLQTPFRLCDICKGTGRV